MSGFTTNLSNLPPGVIGRDIERHFGERDHHTQCPQHELWKPHIDDVLGAAYEVLNVWDETREWTTTNEKRLASAVDDLRRVLVPMCSCREIASAYAEDAAEHAQQEDEGR